MLCVVDLCGNVNSGTNTCFPGFDFIFVLVQFIDKGEGILYSHTDFSGILGNVYLCSWLDLLLTSVSTKHGLRGVYSFRSKS